MPSICRFADEKMKIRNQEKKNKFERKRHVTNFHGNPNECFNNFILRQHFKRLSTQEFHSQCGAQD